MLLIYIVPTRTLITAQTPCSNCHKLSVECVYRPQKDGAGNFVASACHSCYNKQTPCSAASPSKKIKVPVQIGRDIRFLYSDEAELTGVPRLRLPDLQRRVRLIEGLVSRKQIQEWPRWVDKSG